MQPQRSFRCVHLIGSIGVILAIIGLISLIISPTLLESVISSELVLTPDKKTFNIWKKTPMPISLDFYFFNWTNPEDLRNTSIKPRFREIGPYSFREIKEKVNITWNENGTVSFRQLKRWYFDRENSAGDLEDNVTTLNSVAVTAIFQASKLSYVLQKGMSFTLSTMLKDIHITKEVRELLFEGYQDSLMDMAKSMPNIAGVELPPMDKFGWFYMRNGSTDFDGLFNMGTGQKDIPLGVLKRWNHRKSTNYFEGECSNVGGSAGEFWPQNVKPDDTVSMFSPDMCREILFEFDQEVNIKGIQGYKFIGGKRTMDNGTLYPENKCYCNGECVPSGALNVSSCRYGAPGFISFPHFYDADPYYINQFEGLSPQKDKHELSVTLEPRTGIPLAVAARFQINLLMRPSEYVRLLNKVPRLFFPMIWFEQKVTIPDDLALGLKILTHLPTVGTIISGIILGSGICILLAFLVLRVITSTNYFMSSDEMKKKYLTKEEVPLNDTGTSLEFS